MGTKLFNAITVNLETGEISYPQLEGFVLDMDAVVRVAKIHLPFAGSLENAVKHAIHGQLAAFRGAQSLRCGLGR